MFSRISLVGLGLTLTLSAFSLEAAAEERFVVLLSVDGLAARYLDDPIASMPTLQRLAREGARANAMITSFPSLTRPAHVSLMTGTWPRLHGIVGNTYIDRSAQERVDYRDTDAAELVRARTIQDAAHEAGLVTAAVNWPGTRGSVALDWNLPPTRGPSPFDKMTPALADELASAGIRIGHFADWLRNSLQHGAMLDAGFSRVSRYIIKEHEPNLFLVHFKVADTMQHRFGPESEEAYWALSNVDNRIRDIWEALQEPPFRGQSSLFVVSDHGFAPVDKVIRPNVILRREGLISTDADGEVVDRKVWVNGGTAAGVYIFDDARYDELVAFVRETFGSLEGVDRIVGPEEFHRVGLPEPAENPYQADLVLNASPGYRFIDSYSGSDVVVPVSESGAHGYHGQLPTHPLMHATFVAIGAHIRPGARLETVHAVDVAPTIAAILGVELPNASGRVLTEILR